MIYLALDKIFIYTHIVKPLKIVWLWPYDCVELSVKQRLPRVSEQGLELIAARFRALGEPNRLKLVMALQQGEKNVSGLVAETSLGQANVSRHLHTLTAAGILYRRKTGSSAYYGIADDSIFEMCKAVCRAMRSQILSQSQAFQ